MKKKIVSALLVCVLGMSFVTGCGNKEAAAAEATKTADGKIQLDLWYSGGKTAVNVFQEIVDAFNESQDTYEVKTTTQADYTETYEKLQAGIAGKKAPDMALLDTDKSIGKQSRLTATIAIFSFGMLFISFLSFRGHRPH